MIRKRLKGLGVGADMGLTVSLQVVGALVAYAFQIVILQSLSMNDAGMYSLAISYITIASGLADFGLIATITPRLAVAGGEPTPAFKGAFILRGVMLLLGGVAINAYVAATGREEMLPVVNIAYIAAIVGARATGLRQFFELLWRLRGRTYVLTAVSVFDLTLGLAALLLLAYFGEPTVLKVALIFALCNVPGFIIVAMPLLRRLRRSGFFEQRIPKRFYRSLFMMSLPVGAMVVLAQVSGQLETLVLAAFMKPADIAAYTAGTRPLIGLIFVATTLGFGLAPLVAQHARGGGRGSDSSFEFIISVGLRIIGVAGLGICAVCGLFAEQIMGIAGSEYVPHAYILRIFSIINGLTFIVIMFDQFLLAMGKRKETLYGALLYFAVALGLEILIIRDCGISGMMYAKLAAVCALIAFQLVMVGSEVRRAALKALLNLIPPAAALAAALAVTRDLDLSARVPLVLAPFGGAVLLMRTIRLSELKMLRTMRVT